MRTVLVALSCLICACEAGPRIVRDVDPRLPHADVTMKVTHRREISVHGYDQVRYAALHGGPSGFLPMNQDMTVDAHFRAPVGDGYWMFTTEFYHYETENVGINGRTSYMDMPHSDALCTVGGDFHFEDGHSYVLDYVFEGDAKCTLVCTEKRVVDGAEATVPCATPAKS